MSVEKTYMPESVLPPKENRVANSTQRLTPLEIQKASTDIKRFMERRFEQDLNLTKVIIIKIFVRFLKILD